MKFFIAFLALFAIVSGQYLYEAPAVAVPEYPVYTYNSYAPYAYGAGYAGYPFYGGFYGYGSNKGAPSDNKAPAPAPSLTNNRAARV